MSSRDIEKLTSHIARLPGMGARLAGRVVVHLLRRKHTVMSNLISSLNDVYKNTKVCSLCNNIDTQSPCSICSDLKRDKEKICVVSDLTDLWAIERTRSYRGLYFVLGGKLSPINGISPEDIDIEKLIKMIQLCNVNEVIIAMNADIDGQTTLFFINEKLGQLKGLTITTLSHGVPVGGELEYLDDGTISMALKQRRQI